jgi:hypothetical protein
MAADVVSPFRELPRGSLIEAVYQTLLLLDRRKIVSGENDIAPMIDSLSNASGSPITATLRGRIQSVIANIVDQEGIPLREIDDDRIADYRRELNSLVRGSTAEFTAGSETQPNEWAFPVTRVRQSERDANRSRRDHVPKKPAKMIATGI